MMITVHLQKIFLFFLTLSSLMMFQKYVFADNQELTPGKKVLIVASYHEEYRWCHDIVEAIELELAGAELTVFYMDAKRNLAGAKDKAKDAYSLYQKLQPDAVIAIDDTAQEYFVVPYLRDKVATPVFFCGVNDSASKYGFPAANVTGVVEKKHYRESVSFAQIIQPDIRTIGVLYRPSPSNEINVAQIQKEKADYSADVIHFVKVETVDEVRKALTDLSSSVDALILLNMTGIVDEDGRVLEGHDAIATIADATELVTIGASDWEVEAGALCGVIKSGTEQGRLVARQLLSHWEGKAIKDLAVDQNRNGQRFINLATLRRLNLELRPEMVMGTKIISGQ